MEHVTQKQRDEVIAHFKYEGILIDELLTEAAISMIHFC